MATLDEFLAFAAPSSFAAVQRLRNNNAANDVLSDFARASGPEDVRFIQQTIPTYGLNDPSTVKALGMEGDSILERFKAGQQEQASPILEKFAVDYANVAGPDKRFYADPESRQVLQASGLKTPDDSQNPYVRKGLQEFIKQGQFESDLADQFANPGDNNVLARLASNPMAQAQNSIISTLQTGQNQAAGRTAADAKVAEEKAGKANLADFQSAIAGLTGPAQSPAGISRFAKRGGFDTFPGVESDIRQAAAAYGVGDSDEVNKAITGARDTYKNTSLEPETGKIGRTTYTGQRNLLNDLEKDAASTAPVTNIYNTTRGERKDEFALRKEFLSLPEVKEFPTIEANASRAVTALKAPGSKLAVDQALITVFNKMIDPTSVVRESEYARTPGDMAVLSRIKGKWGKIQEGGAGLPPEERAALARMITNFSAIASKQYNARAGEYRQLAKEYGFEPGRVVARQNGLDNDKGADLQSAAAAELARRKGGK